jgi:preprotein translocase subunit SecF
MELFDPKKLNFNFVKSFRLFVWISAIFSVLCLGSLFWPGLNYGIDFRGGIEAVVSFTDPNVKTEDLRNLLNDKVKNLSIVEANAKDGSGKKEFYLNIQEDDVAKGTQTLKTSLDQAYPNAYTIGKMDSVGPKVGAELRKSALLALFYTCILIGLYMYWRFDARYSPGALLTIFHDLIFTVGFLVVTQMEFSTTVVAGLLTLAGYSINDTVVVFDRIRELEAKSSTMDKKQLVNIALNSTLSRTVMTAGTTLFSCLVLYFVGGEGLQPFAATLFFGIIVGTYSSLYVGAPAYLWGNKMFGVKTSMSTSRGSAK